MLGAGALIESQYRQERARQPSQSIQTSGGNTACRRIYFIPGPEMSQNANRWIFRKFVSEAMTMVTNDKNFQIRSVAFPAIGCGDYNCNINFVTQTLITAVVYELEKRPSLRLNVYFVIPKHRQEIFSTFDNELEALRRRRTASSTNSCSMLSAQLLPRPPKKSELSNPFTVEKRSLAPGSDEYAEIQRQFQSKMTAQLFSEIVRIELIWKKRWYQQYMIHYVEFSRRLGENTEQMLFHGCSEEAANSIINECFNRSCAGVHGRRSFFIQVYTIIPYEKLECSFPSQPIRSGDKETVEPSQTYRFTSVYRRLLNYRHHLGTAYGQGIYFSSKISYSHNYATPNAKGERNMFLALVLVGKTIKRTSTMNICPIGYGTTTDGSHIYVTYHDSQAFGKYLISYK